MKDVVEFEKLFKLNFPMIEHVDYYIETLIKSSMYSWVPQRVQDFEEFENFAISQGYNGAKNYKLDYALPKLKEFLLGTPAYNRLQNLVLSNVKLRTKDNLREFDGDYLLSIDFRAANYNTLKFFDEEGMLQDSWNDLCKHLDIHPTLAMSKSFRQYAFGKTNPSRLQKIQHTKILSIIDGLKLVGLREDDIAFISHDEVVIKLSGDAKSASSQSIHLVRQANQIIEDEGIGMIIHHSVFKNEALKKSMCLQTVYNPKMSGLSEMYQTLFKVPGNKFFKYFKKFVLKESIDKRDLTFMNDGEVAIWAEEEDSIAETFLPEGELSLQEIEQDHYYFLAQLRDNVPGLSIAQCRKIINVTLGLCHHCFNSDGRCQCWNDE